MTNRNIFRHAVCLVAGVLLFAFGASRMISGPVEQVAQSMHHQTAQIVGVDP